MGRPMMVWEGVSETLIPEHGHGALPVAVEKSFENKPDRPGFHPIAFAGLHLDLPHLDAAVRDEAAAGHETG